ncbi:MAG: alpha/beta fold hydrolase [Bacillota bacterium]
MAGILVNWVLQSYPPEEAALSYLEEDSGVSYQQEGDYHIFAPGGEGGSPSLRQGVIFYPGGQVEALAYSQLAYHVAEAGYPVVLVEMPFQLAILDWDKAEGVYKLFPELTTWHLAGHSLGGAMAARYVSRDKPDMVAGLILLAAYPAESDDLAEQNIRVLSIYGSNDEIVNQELLQERESLLAEERQLLEIEGGNHAGFGQYGDQSGDGKAEITSSAQIKKTTEAIVRFLEDQYGS